MIKVVTPKHTLFAANHLVNQLAKLGLQAEVREFCDLSDNSLHIIYQASPLYRLPKRYIVCQTEIAGSHWFNARYRETLKKAIAVWDYSEKNFSAYDHPRRTIVTPGINYQVTGEKDIDLLFYGWIQGSDRRAKILSDYKRMTDLRIEENTTGQAMWDILKRTKEVLNVHYYNDSPLELYRLNESISHGCKVWLFDEDREYTEYYDNFKEVIFGMAMAKVDFEVPQETFAR